jgi:anion-transporting  ArsA/GET3 family ATPase
MKASMPATALALAFCGKGGVGKTTQATSTARWLASQGYRVCILDTDRGHSVPRALGRKKGEIPANTLFNVEPNLDVVIIEGKEFVSATKAFKELRWSVDQYLEQFPGDMGLVPWADMLKCFFGVPADIPTVEKFVVLVYFLLKLKEEKYDVIIVDVEPTGGLERLLSGVDDMSNSLVNLGNKSNRSLFISMLGVKMPHVVGYLKGDYLKKASHYTKRIKEAVTMLQHTLFFGVSIPEEEGIDQLKDNQILIESFGGTLAGIIVNRVRDLPYERELIASLGVHGVPVLEHKERLVMHESAEGKRASLEQMGKDVVEHFELLRAA